MNRIDSTKNLLVRRMASLRERAGREAEGLIFVEGEKMIAEALGAGHKMEYLFVPDGAVSPFSFEETYQVKPHVLKAMSDTVTPQGVAAAFKMPLGAPKLAYPVVALDGVQDPGNVGTIWRTADAAGYRGLLLGEGCADALSPKVQRATMGSCFRVGFRAEALVPSLSEMVKDGAEIIAGSLDGENVYAHTRPGDKHVLVIGSEAHGIREEVMALSTSRVKIPMRGGAESLNAAVSAGILMYMLTEAEG